MSIYCANKIIVIKIHWYKVLWTVNWDTYGQVVGNVQPYFWDGRCKIEL